MLDPSSSVLRPQDQIGLVLEAHRSRLLAMLRRRVDGKLAVRIDAEDVLSETYLVAQRRWSEFSSRPGGQHFPWLYRISLDCLIEAWRRETRACRDPREEMPWPDRSSLQMGFGLVETGTSPSEAAAREEVCAAMRRALGQLSEADREVLRMRHEDELTHAEAGEVLGIGENAAAVRYLRALRRLRALWSSSNHEG